ncbi:helix-turn-helix domain-containing protein [Streptomyces sparsogenes DSM 40356]|uniref:Helix-turn-helix domain-containing protein n=2 Tax=Streptomyces sparsogenes TaxID=67365 RepID=A0A1R1SQ99_9ACTN|nr:helix-turn-helix transcriptional regulator [Streptomyces sparsogenes]OMI40397.1 helix-turn-helix domain-containing protein [Streptomyces sparsogenes DSM 40356]
MNGAMKEGQEPLSGAAFFGAEVRAWRLKAGLSQRELGLKANYGQQYVAKVEAGERLASPEFADACDRVFGTPGTFARLRQRASQHGYPEWFVPYVQLERQATGISNYSVARVTGLLQTADYARAVFRAAHPRDGAETIDAKVERRLRRRAVMEKDTPPLLWCVLNEACLRINVGGAEIMRAQLAHVLAEADSPNVAVQVLPFGAGALPAGESFTLLTFSEGPGVVYEDTAMGGRVIDSPAEVDYATATYERLRAAALHPDESLAMIRRIMEEYT